jgi:hypothetical protein
MSYLRYVCLPRHSGVQHILCSVLCCVCLRLMYLVLAVVHSLLPLRFSLMLIIF